MDDDEETIIQMLKAGSKGYLLKDIHPDTLHLALTEVLTKGHFYTDNVTTALLRCGHDHPRLVASSDWSRGAFE